MTRVVTAALKTATAKRRNRVVVSDGTTQESFDWVADIPAANNYLEAARAYVEKRQWVGTWIGGTLPDGSRVFLCVDTSMSGFQVTARAPK